MKQLMTSQLPQSSDLNNSFTEKISNLNLDIGGGGVGQVNPRKNVPRMGERSRRFFTAYANPFPHEEEYIESILSRWYEMEKTHKINANYMSKQKEISHKMRYILVDWLVEVAGEYNIHNATLHRGVQFVDRYLHALYYVLMHSHNKSHNIRVCWNKVETNIIIIKLLMFVDSWLGCKYREITSSY